jgi:outer membrane protein assembly factor BamD (BamD/ComL family)
LEAPKTADAPAVVHRPAAVEPKANDHLNDEADLLKRAQRAINSGDTSGALALLQQHATTYPSGVLGQERIGLRAITLCRAGQRDQGVAEATRFLKGNPSSPLSERVKSSCELK